MEIENMFVALNSWAHTHITTYIISICNPSMHLKCTASLPQLSRSHCIERGYVICNMHILEMHHIKSANHVPSRDTMAPCLGTCISHHRFPFHHNCVVHEYKYHGIYASPAPSSYIQEIGILNRYFVFINPGINNLTCALCNNFYI